MSQGTVGPIREFKIFIPDIFMFEVIYYITNDYLIKGANF